MSILRYKVTSPLRLLLPVSGVLLALPFIFKDLLMYTTVPLFYFLGVYFFLLNFPSISEMLHSKPLYLEDLIVDREKKIDNTFKNAYGLTMNFILAVLFAGLAEYVIIQGIRDKPVIEVIAIVGGNLGIYLKIQNISGRILLKICHCYLQRNENKKHLTNTNSSIEIREIKETKTDNII